MTPYEFGRETGRLQAQISTEMDISKAYKIADLLAIGKGKPEFFEGYRNGFTEAKAAQVPNPEWIQSDEEEETYEEYLKRDKSKFELEECYTLLPAEAAVKEEPEWQPSDEELDEIEEELPAEESPTNRMLAGWRPIFEGIDEQEAQEIIKSLEAKPRGCCPDERHPFCVENGY